MRIRNPQTLKGWLPIHPACLRRSGYAQAGAWPYEPMESGLAGPVVRGRKTGDVQPI